MHDCHLSGACRIRVTLLLLTENCLAIAAWLKQDEAVEDLHILNLTASGICCRRLMIATRDFQKGCI